MWSKEDYCHNITCNIFFHLEDVKTDHFKPPSSSEVPKTEDTFYIEWHSKSCSLSWCTILWVYQSFSFCILALKRPSFTGTRVSDEDNITMSNDFKLLGSATGLHSLSTLLMYFEQDLDFLIYGRSCLITIRSLYEYFIDLSQNYPITWSNEP